MNYPDLICFSKVKLTGIGDEPNAETFEAQKKAPVRISRHHGCERDEHDRFMPRINMPVNIKD